MALTSFLTEPGAPDDGMALFGSPPGLPGGTGMARPSRKAAQLGRTDGMALNPPSSRAPHTGMARLGSSGHQGTDGMALNPPGARGTDGMALNPPGSRRPDGMALKPPGRTDGMALNPPRSRLPDGTARQLPG